MSRHVVAALVLVLAFSGLAQAQSYTDLTQRANHWEFSIQTRYTAAKDFEGDHGTKLELDDDLGWGFGFGYNLSDNFNLGMSFMWRSIGYNATVFLQDDPNNAVYYSNWLDTSNVALTGDWNILRKRITPYVNGSVGWIALDTNIYAGTDWGCYWDPWYGYVCYDYSSTYGNDAASWSLGAGLRAELTPTVFARIGYDHGWVDASNYDGSDMFRVDLGGLF